MGWHSHSRKHGPSFTNLINVLIASIIVGIMGFVALPSFLLTAGSTSAAREINSNMKSNRSSAMNKKRLRRITHRSGAPVSAFSGVTRTVNPGAYERGSKSRDPGRENVPEFIAVFDYRGPGNTDFVYLSYDE